MKKAILTLALALFALLVMVPAATPAHAMSASFYYKAGYSIQSGWLCYGWSNGVYHCTSHWHYSNGVAISDNTAWVPNYTAPKPPPSSSGGSVPWQGGSSNHYPWGQCTWGAAHLAYDNVDYLGNAKDWFYNARARGRSVGYTPRVNATVVFQPGVQGASWQFGHVAHVVKLGSNGSFEVEEMNVSGVPGGGFGRFSYRWVHTGSGVSFIY